MIGSGFAGSLLAASACRQGRSVMLIEKGRHPRFAIGESSTPLSNLLLESLALRYDLRGIAPLAKWGTWLDVYPDLDCGLKRGFTFYQHQFGKPATFLREDQLLVAASPHDAIADTHWNRADVDAHFVREAEQAGVEYLDEVELRSACESDDGVDLAGQRHGGDIRIRAKFVVDGTGPRGFLHRALALPEKELPGFPATQALYTHFTGVGRVETGGGEGTPYPPDDAAMHHVFEGGWIWVLRFRSGVTSAGAAVTDSLAADLKLSDGAPAWERLIRSLPTVYGQFARAIPVRPFVHAPRLAFRSGAISGNHWALLPSAAGFVDPLLSTGFPLVLLGVTRLAELFETHWGSLGFAARLKDYAIQTDADLLTTARLIASLYSAMGDFRLFASLTLLYFAAASFAESARRLGKERLANSFLLRDHPQFGMASAELLDRANRVGSAADSQALRRDILRAIEPFNVAGLGDPQRRNWYPARAEDLLAAGAKLECTADEIEGLLERCGFRSS